MKPITTEIGRGSFVRVMKPKLNQKGELKYSIMMIWGPGTDMTKVKNALAATRDAQWPNPKARPRGLKNPLHKCEERAIEGDNGELAFEDGHMAGGYYMSFSASAEHPPKVVDRLMQKIVDDSEVYSGAYFRVSFVPFVFDYPESKGIGVGLRNVQKVRDGEALAGRSDPADDFTALDEGENAEAGVAAGDLDWEE